MEELIQVSKKDWEDAKRIESELHAELKKRDDEKRDALEKEKIDKLVAEALAKLHPSKEEKIMKFVKSMPEKPEEGVEYNEGGLGEFCKMVRNGDSRIAHLKGIPGNVNQKTGTPMTTTDAQGGYFIPTDLLAGVMNEINEQSEIIPMLGKLEYSGGSIDLSSLLTDLSIAWSTEGTAKSATKPTFSSENFALRFLYAIITSTKELQLDSITDIPGLLEKLVGENIALEIENQVFNTNANPFTGLLFAAGVNNVPQAGASLSYDDLVDTMYNTGQLQQYRKKSRWFMNIGALAIIAKLKDNDNRPIWAMGIPQAGVPPTILGKPYTVATQITQGDTTTIYFGDMSTVWRGKKKGQPDGINVLFTEVAVVGSENLFTENKVGWRFEKRDGTIVSVGEAWTKLTNVS